MFSSVQSLSRVQLFATRWSAARQAFLSITDSWSLLKLISVESVMSSNHLVLCHPLLLPPSIFLSIRVFSNVSSSHQVAKVLEFQLQHQSFNEYSGLISFGIDWFDFLAVRNYCCGKWLNRLAPLSYHKLLICIKQYLQSTIKQSAINKVCMYQETFY